MSRYIDWTKRVSSIPENLYHDSPGRLLVVRLGAWGGISIRVVYPRLPKFRAWIWRTR